MNPSPHLPILSLVLLLLPALPVQAWFVRLLPSSSAHRQTKTHNTLNPSQTNLLILFFRTNRTASKAPSTAVQAAVSETALIFL